MKRCVDPVTCYRDDNLLNSQSTSMMITQITAGSSSCQSALVHHPGHDDAVLLLDFSNVSPYVVKCGKSSFLFCNHLDFLNNKQQKYNLYLIHLPHSLIHVIL